MNPPKSDATTGLPGWALCVDEAHSGGVASEMLRERMGWTGGRMPGVTQRLPGWLRGLRAGEDGQGRITLTDRWGGDVHWTGNAWWSDVERGWVIDLAEIDAADTSPPDAATLLAQLPAPVAWFDASPEGRCIVANRAFVAFVGGDVAGDAAVVGRPVEEFLPAALLALWERTRHGGSAVVTAVHESANPDGRPRSFDATLLPGRDAGGGGQDVRLLMTDITERRLADAALRASEERLLTFLQASAEGVVFHREGVITDANPAACALLGVELDALRGLSVLDFTPSELRDTARQLIASHADAMLRGTVLNAHGQRIPVEISSRSLLRHGQRLRMAVIRDVRDRQAAQQRIDELIESLRRQKDRAEAADHAKSVFLAAASHDLRQPIHALGLFLSALRTMAQGPSVPRTELAEIVLRMQSSLDGLGQLLNMLLDVSRLDANAVDIHPQPTAVAPLLDDLARDFAALAREKGLRLRIAPTTHWVHTDPTVLRRILANLLANAIRYTPRGAVMIAPRVRGNRLCIQVRDSGIGIEPAQQQAIFNEFYQVESQPAQHHDTHGLGLGLSIVQRSAQLLGAPLHLRSAPGRGSVFAISVPLLPPHEQPQQPLPAAPVAAPPPQDTADPPAATAPRRLGVLVIDDEDAVLYAMQRLLSTWGHRVWCAASADEAVVHAIAHAHEIDLLISDYRLGANTTAVQAIEAVHACLQRPVPTYILTGDTSPQRIALTAALGWPLLHKPVSPNDILRILQEVP